MKENPADQRGTELDAHIASVQRCLSQARRHVEGRTLWKVAAPMGLLISLIGVAGTWLHLSKLLIAAVQLLVIALAFVLKMRIERRTYQRDYGRTDQDLRALLNLRRMKNDLSYSPKEETEAEKGN